MPVQSQRWVFHNLISAGYMQYITGQRAGTRLKNHSTLAYTSVLCVCGLGLTTPCKCICLYMCRMMIWSVMIRLWKCLSMSAKIFISLVEDKSLADLPLSLYPWVDVFHAHSVFHLRLWVVTDCTNYICFSMMRSES